MYGKRFVTGDRQKACLFEQKGSYMASIKDSNGQFKTLQLGTNRPVAFKQFFAAASAAGFASAVPAAPDKAATRLPPVSAMKSSYR